MPTSFMTSPSRVAVDGVTSDGLATTVSPLSTYSPLMKFGSCRTVMSLCTERVLPFEICGLLREPDNPVLRGADAGRVEHFERVHRLIGGHREAGLAAQRRGELAVVVL